MAELDRDEFISHMNLVREDIKQVHVRLDTQNGRIRTAEIKIALMWLLWVLVGVLTTAVLPDALRRIL